MEEIAGASWMVMVLLELAVSGIWVEKDEDPAGSNIEIGVLLELVVIVMLAP